MSVAADLDRLRIVCYPDPVLRRHCETVSEFGPDLTALAARMLELMRAGNGIGLAAPQVGLPIRLFVCNPTGNPEDDRICVNPTLSELVGSVEADEGCLSLPEVSVPMRRAESAALTAHNTDGGVYTVSGEGLQARVWQHEHDHLEGRLIIDRMPTSAELANRRILKQLRDAYNARKKE